MSKLINDDHTKYYAIFFFLLIIFKKVHLQ